MLHNTLLWSGLGGSSMGEEAAVARMCDQIARDAAERPLPEPGVPVSAGDDQVGVALPEPVDLILLVGGVQHPRESKDVVASEPGHDVLDAFQRLAATGIALCDL